MPKELKFLPPVPLSTRVALSLAVLGHAAQSPLEQTRCTRMGAAGALGSSLNERNVVLGRMRGCIVAAFSEKPQCFEPVIERQVRTTVRLRNSRAINRLENK